MLVQVVQHNVGLGVPAQLYYDTHPLAVGLVPDVADSFDPLVPGQMGDLFHQSGLVHLERQFGDNDPFPSAALLLDVGGGLHDDAAAPSGVGVYNADLTVDAGPGGEVGSFDVAHQVFGGTVGMIDQVADSVGDFGQVMRRNVGCHAHGDACCPVDQHVGQPGGQYPGFLQRIIEVGREVHGIVVDVGQHFFGDAS